MEKLVRNFALVLTIFAGFACSSPQQDDTASSDEGTTEAPAAAETASLADGTYALASDATVGWEGSKAAYSHVGTINVSEGSFTVAGGSITGGAFTIDMASIINTDVEDPEKNQQFVGHLMSDDFFGVEAHPQAMFKITEVKAGGEGDATHTITGDLTLKSITNSISFPAMVGVDAGMATVKGEAVIDRSDWEVKFNSPDFPEFANLAADKIISNDIKIMIDLKASGSAM